MRKFSKILTLILAIVAILTAFTVVALAEDEPGYVQKPANDVFGIDTTFEKSATGTVTTHGWRYDADGTARIAISEAYPGGNKFMLITGTSGETAGTVFSYMGGDVTANRENYNMAKYPVVAFDFDLMTPNGNWGLVSTSASEYNSGNSAGIGFRPYYNAAGSMASVGWGSPWFEYISFGCLGLPTTAYKWHHVTVVFELTSETAGETTTEYVTQTVYVNGEPLDPAGSLSKWVTGKKVSITKNKGTASTMFFGPVSVKSARYGAASKQVIDNMQYTYFEQGYFDAGKTLADVATNIYNDSWEAPFGQTIATVTVGEGEVSYFDDINKAADFAKDYPGAEISLAGNITAPYIVDTDLTINAGTYTGADTYARTTKGYYLEETEEGSGIYKSKMGNVALIDTAGNMTAYPESKFSTACTSAKAGYTVKLLSDIETASRISPSVAYTLDLNGFTLKRISYGGNVYEATKDAEGNLSFGTESLTATNTASSGAFITMGGSIVFKITSSRPGGTVYNATASANTWYFEGEMVKREVNSITPQNFASHVQSNATLDISNISIYSSRLVESYSGSPDNVTIKIDNVNYYQMKNETAIFTTTTKNYTLKISNSLLYFRNNGDLLFDLDVQSTGGKTTVDFINCDIIKAGGNSYSLQCQNAKSAAYAAVTFDGSRVYDLFTTASNKPLGKNGTFYCTDTDAKAYPDTTNGYQSVKKSFTKTYTVPSSQSFTKSTSTDGNIVSVSVSEMKPLSCTFDTLVTKAIDINWIDTDGKAITTTQLTPGVSNLDTDAYRYVKELEDNDYLNLLCQWTDEDGNAASGILGRSTDKGVAWPEGIVNEDGTVTYSYNFYANETLNGDTKYVGGIKAVDFNLGFLSGFRYNLYIPVDTRLTDVLVDGFDEGSIVLIEGKEYTVWSKLVGTAAAAEANTISATFKVDGAEYSQTWSINAIQYANLLLGQPSEKYPTEAKALGTMAKLIKEAVALTGSSADVAAIDALIAKSGVGSDYDDYTGAGDADFLTPFNGAVTSVQFVVYNGVAAYRFITAAEDTEISFTVNGEEFGFTREGTKVTLDAMRVYDLIDTISVTANGVTASVSMLDYLTAMNGETGMELAKALYEFGVAADAYRKEIIANN